MEEWKEYRLGDIGRIITGKTPSTACKTNYGGKTPFLTPSDDLSVKHTYKTIKTLSEQGVSSVINCLIPAESICVSCIGSDLGKVTIINTPAVTNQQINSIVVNKDKFDIDFVYYSMKIIGRLMNYHSKTSTAVPIINKTQFSNYKIKIPSLPTQQKIAAILSSLDDKIELNNKINTNLEQQIEALLLDYLSKKETTSVKLGDYLYIKGRIGWKGLKKNEYLSESKYRIVNGETLTKSGIDWNKAGYISEERYTESPEIMLQVGDILLSKDGTIGKIGYVDELELPTSVASGIFVIRNNNPSEISTTFIYYLLKSKIFDSFIIARTEGSVIPHLYQKDFMDFDFPLPSPELMNKFEKITQPMFSQIINNLKENKKLNSLRDSLLPKLMNGEIEV